MRTQEQQETINNLEKLDLYVDTENPKTKRTVDIIAFNKETGVTIKGNLLTNGKLNNITLIVEARKDKYT
jgi:hypothetical protein